MQEECWSQSVFSVSMCGNTKQSEQQQTRAQAEQPEDSAASERRDQQLEVP